MSIKINSGAFNTVLRRLTAGSRGLKTLRGKALAAVGGLFFFTCRENCVYLAINNLLHNQIFLKF